MKIRTYKSLPKSTPSQGSLYRNQFVVLQWSRSGPCGKGEIPSPDFIYGASAHTVTRKRGARPPLNDAINSATLRAQRSRSLVGMHGEIDICT